MSRETAELEAPVHQGQPRRTTFARPPKKNFQKAVTERVDAYFETNNIPRTANFHMRVKIAVILAGWAGTYVLILTNALSPLGALGLALVHGFATALIGLNIGHDAVHGSLFRNEGMNKLARKLFNVVGANDYVWRISHNIVHHTYTNVPDHDGDIRSLPVLRMEPTQERWPIHRFQFIYAFAFYCVSSLVWVLVKDYVQFFKKKLGSHYRETFPKREIYRLFYYKAIYYALFIAAPLVFVEVAWYWILVGFVASHMIEGFTLTITFMLAHIVEGTSFPEPDEDGKIDVPWADMQLYTTVNFATRSKLVNFIMGGLNFQIEHHLFPMICHIHYPQLAPIVKETALEFGLPYIEFKTLGNAIASHVRMLKHFGNHD